MSELTFLSYSNFSAIILASSVDFFSCSIWSFRPSCSWFEFWTRDWRSYFTYLSYFSFYHKVCISLNSLNESLAFWEAWVKKLESYSTFSSSRCTFFLSIFWTSCYLYCLSASSTFLFLCCMRDFYSLISFLSCSFIFSYCLISWRDLTSSIVFLRFDYFIFSFWSWISQRSSFWDEILSWEVKSVGSSEKGSSTASEGSTWLLEECRLWCWSLTSSSPSSSD